MKERVSATIEPETRKSIEKMMKSGRYRNISHLIEDAIKLLEEKNGK
jgi:Arc/MetJ-type ribon-helix-helix transcriptional regulator